MEQRCRVVGIPQADFAYPTYIGPNVIARTISIVLYFRNEIKNRVDAIHLEPGYRVHQGLAGV